MAIERAIHASLKIGIEKNDAGFQYYSYTPDYKIIMEKDRELEGKLNSFYKAPDTEEWLMNLPHDSNITMPSDNKEANEAELKARKYHPLTMAYKLMDVDGNKRPVFLFGKNMGIDWTGRRIGNYYNAAVICEMTDVKKAPVLYCDSPVVCCDIMRTEFYPEGEASAPALLKYTKGLEKEDDTLEIRHQAGFEAISENDIIDFIGKEGRIDILKSMLTALMKLKEGDKSCRIIIGDEKDNIILWIAAISHIFPVQNIMDFSFTTYGYNIEEYDVNGVFVPALNGAQNTEYDVTAYNYTRFKDAFAVYDFEKQDFASKVEVNDNLLMQLIENAFSIDMKPLEKYKQYIVSSTTYRGMDSQYVAGYNLYAYMNTKLQLSDKELESAVKFAENFAGVEEKKNLMDKLMKNYQSYLNDQFKMDLFADYMKHCIDKGVISKEEVDSALLELVFECFEETDRYQISEFVAIGEAVEKICGLEAGGLEKAFVEGFGFEELERQVHIIKDKKRLMYIFSAVLSYAEKGYCSLEKGSVQYNIVCSALYYTVEDETERNVQRVRQMMEDIVTKMPSARAKFQCAEAVYNVFNSKSLNRITEIVLNRTVKMYMESSVGDKREFLQEVLSTGTNDIYLNAIMTTVSEDKNILKKMDELQGIVQNFSTEFAAYIGEIKDTAISTLGITRKVQREERPELVYSCFKLVKLCENNSDIPSVKTDYEQIKDAYLDCLYEEHNDFIIDETARKQLITICSEVDSVEEVWGDPALIFLKIYEMQTQVKSKKDKNAFTGKSEYPKINIEGLKPGIKRNYIKSVAVLGCHYRFNTDKYPELDELFEVPESAQDGCYSLVLKDMLECVLDNIKGKDRARCAVDVIEYGLTWDAKQFKKDVPGILVNSGIKQSDITKIFEKDIEDKQRTKKGAKAAEDVDISDLIDIFQAIKEQYGDEPEGIAAIASKLKNLFGRNK